MINGLRHVAPAEGDYTGAVLTYKWQCFKCGRIHTQDITLRQGDEIQIPVLPAEWVKVNGRLYCSQHKVHMLVFVDGVRQP